MSLSHSVLDESCREDLDWTPVRIDNTPAATRHSSSNPSSLEQKAMRKHCPVRALLFYLDRTKALRKDSQLLVSYKPGLLGKKVTKGYCFYMDPADHSDGILFNGKVPTQIGGHGPLH